MLPLELSEPGEVSNFQKARHEQPDLLGGSHEERHQGKEGWKTVLERILKESYQKKDSERNVGWIFGQWRTFSQPRSPASSNWEG